MTDSYQPNYLKKITTLSNLVAEVGPLRQDGKKVILTNGCFDLLHAGHVRYLQGARDLLPAEQALLIVAINSDASVRRLKGPNRPIVPQAHRAELVAALHVVDRVVIFEESDVTALISALHPEYHAKGTDYTADTVPERNIVKQYGGQVCIVGDPKERSTQDLLGMIRRKYLADPDERK